MLKCNAEYYYIIIFSIISCFYNFNYYSRVFSLVLLCSLYKNDVLNFNFSFKTTLPSIFMVGEISIKIIHGSTPVPFGCHWRGKMYSPKKAKFKKKTTHMGKYQNCKIHGPWVRAQAVEWGQYYQLVKMY